jgi:hypothetical protein
MRVIATTLFAVTLALAGAPRLATAQELNACGCYREDSGACKCTASKAKCTCPGDCEPVTCEAKRQRDANREAAATLQKIKAREKQRATAAAHEASMKKGTKPKPKAKAAQPPAPKDEIDKLLEKQ